MMDLLDYNEPADGELLLGIALNCFNVSQMSSNNLVFARKIEKSMCLWDNTFEMN